MTLGRVASSLVTVLIALSAQPGKNQVKYDPENGVRPIRALLAISEEPVKPGSSCDKGRLLPDKSGPQQVGDMLAVLLAYHDSGTNSVRGSCEKTGDSTCTVSFRHKKNAQAEEEFAVFKFKLVNDKAQAGSLECNLSP